MTNAAQLLTQARAAAPYGSAHSSRWHCPVTGRFVSSAFAAQYHAILEALESAAEASRRMGKYHRIQAIGGLPVEAYKTPNDKAADRAMGWGWKNGRHETT